MSTSDPKKSGDAKGTSATPKPKAKADRGASIRLQRYLASAGFGSRRQCEEWILEGRVEVNGNTVDQLGTIVDPKADKVLVDGSPLRPQRLVYFAVNKPVGVVTTNRDPKGRPRVIDLVPPDERVFPVGRLDRQSEGLILVTNDGELAQALTHPKYGIRKVYRVTVAGKVDPEAMKQMRRGIHIAEGFVKVEGVKLMKTRGRSSELQIVLAEGKNREIRRILARLGHKVMTLRRIAVGPIKLGDVPAGAYRKLTRDELTKLQAAVSTDAAESNRKGRAGQRSRPAPAGRKRGVQQRRSNGQPKHPRGVRVLSGRVLDNRKTRPEGDDRSAKRATTGPRGTRVIIRTKPDGNDDTDLSGAVIGSEETAKPKPKPKPKSRTRGAKASKSLVSKNRSTKGGQPKRGSSGTGGRRQSGAAKTRISAAKRKRGKRS
ncbi:MAG: pseudouridine synthase [Planctomycetota bacterium]